MLRHWIVSVAAMASLSGCAPSRPADLPAAPPPVVQSLQGWCANLPRAANAALPVAPVKSDWFQVYQAAQGVYAFVEPYQLIRKPLMRHRNRRWIRGAFIR